MKKLLFLLLLTVLILSLACDPSKSINIEIKDTFVITTYSLYLPTYQMIKDTIADIEEKYHGDCSVGIRSNNSWLNFIIKEQIKKPE